ncbi:hypothetical protein ISU10_02495 [Nocardioides agariphilus]|uniref:Homeodomain-like domain-containing protein n=1 Tax=Nocardioides agariphilus TaxID=433664 RepID=A0A930YL24_9ACTN|nr:hypothetical protein [Nocardioides agariphilus]MBF4766634.1 hypothetical protein [Nocardioides agariphilus]
MIEVPPEFIELVVLGWRQKLLAERFGVTDRTVRRWLSDPQVALLVAERREEVQCAIAGRLTGMAESAFAVLETLLSDASDSVRLRAVQLVLDQLSSTHRALMDRQADTSEARILAATTPTDRRVPTSQGVAS